MRQHTNDQRFGISTTDWRYGVEIPSWFGSAGRSVTGDANASNALNLADTVCLLTYLFGSAGEPCKESVAQCLDATDANDDGAVDIADAIAVLSHLFAGAGPLPDPFGDCGVDPTVDELACASYEPRQDR